MLEQFLGPIEEELIRRAMARAKGNKTKAASLLGMTRPRLYRRLVQLGMEEPEESCRSRECDLSSPGASWPTGKLPPDRCYGGWTYWLCLDL